MTEYFIKIDEMHWWMPAPASDGELAFVAAAPAERPHHDLLMGLRIYIDAGDWRQLEVMGLSMLLRDEGCITHDEVHVGCVGQ